jgi:hypothetical protein
MVFGDTGTTKASTRAAVAALLRIVGAFPRAIIFVPYDETFWCLVNKSAHNLREWSTGEIVVVGTKD